MQLKVTVDCELNGIRLEGFPKIARREVTEGQSFTAVRATGGGYVALPLGELTTIQALVLTADQALSVQLGATEEADISLAAGGLIILIDASNTAANAKVSNASGSDAEIVGLGGGI
jgi:hypothetical protein